MPPPRFRPRGPRAVAVALALALGLCIAADLWQMPVQLHDAVFELLDAQQSASPLASFTAASHTTAYLRPLRIAQIKTLFDLSQGAHLHAVFRGFHAVLLVAALLLFAGATRVCTPTDLAAAAFALLVLIGLHTFRGNVQEAFPINHFVEMVVACLLVLNLARSHGGIGVDALAAVTFAAAVLTLESGLLVWVVAMAAWLVGWRGISTRGIVAMTLLLAAYLFVRFSYLHTGTPALTERSSGFLLSVLDPVDLQRRFGADPRPFYAYNVVTSAMSVLFSEPRAGVFAAVRDWDRGALLPRSYLQLITSGLTTSLLCWSAVWCVRARRLDDTARMFAVFGAVLAANAVLSFAYTKDEIITVAGAFYALAVFAAVADLLRAKHRHAGAGIAVTALVAVLACGWAIRAGNVHYLLRAQAFRHQNDWAGVPEAWSRRGSLPADPAARQLLLNLRRDAVMLRIPNPRAQNPDWIEDLWED